MKRRQFLKSLLGLPPALGLYLAFDGPDTTAFSHPLLNRAKQMMLSRQQQGLVFCLPTDAHDRRALACALYTIICGEPYLGIGGLVDHRHFIAEYRAAMNLAANTVMICLEEKVVTARWGHSAPFSIVNSGGDLTAKLSRDECGYDGPLASRLAPLAFGDGGSEMAMRVEALKLRCDPDEMALADASPEMWIREQLNSASAEQLKGSTRMDANRDRLARAWLAVIAMNEDSKSMSWVDEELIKLARIRPTLPLGTRQEPTEGYPDPMKQPGPFAGRPYLEFQDAS